MGPNATDKSFVDLVAQLVRGLLSEEVEANLLDDANLDRLYAALVVLKRDVESQLSAQRSRDIKKHSKLNASGDDGTEWIAYKASEADWRARVTKFLASVEGYIADVRFRIKERNRKMNGISTIDLFDAIAEHSEEIDSEHMTDADQKLYRAAGIEK